MAFDVGDAGRQKLDHRMITIAAEGAHDCRRYDQPEIARLDGLDLLPAGARLPTRPWHESEADTARDQGQLQIIALDFRAKI